jgi:SAM-dependent methyltransferase
MEKPKNPHSERLPLSLHAVRLLASAAVAGAFRCKRLTRFRLFRALMAFIFGRLAHRYEEIWSRLPGGGWRTMVTPLREALSDPLIGPPPRRFLDIACGTARASRLAAGRFPEVTLVGLDLALPMLRQARILWGEDRSPVHLVAGDAASPPFAPGSFDLVVVMNGPPEPEAVRGLLAPGGWAVFAYSFPYSPAVRPHIRRRLKEAGFAFATIRPSGLGVLAMARTDAATEG